MRSKSCNNCYCQITFYDRNTSKNQICDKCYGLIPKTTRSYIRYNIVQQNIECIAREELPVCGQSIIAVHQHYNLFVG